VEVLVVGKDKLSEKIAIVKREDPALSNSQAVGKAAGILRHRAKKKGRLGK
jgi:hypothetical protein